ncbi:Rid family hydrolase [Agromyces sp. ZXT2-6]|uniref:Rid family hydrolase n=1 Tax=Agromyces sp. ZXT2-6 TaxID=3461153 RepID=UPI004055229C
MTITIETEPVDEHGYLVHAEDATAQLCLALVRLEAALRERGLDLSAVDGVRVRAVDARLAAELVEIAVERFAAAAVAPAIACVPAVRLGIDDMLVAISADVSVTHRIR